jgi:DNA-binding CsgD family transcriptional regulator
MRFFEEFSAVAQAGSTGVLRAAVERLAGQLEFERYSLQLVRPRAEGGYHWTTLENVPKEYLEIWQKPGNGAHCPVMQHLRTSKFPLMWGRETYERKRQLQTWEEQEVWGYGAGFACATHLGNDKHVLFGLERTGELTDTRERLTEKLAAFQLFATFAVDAALTVLGDEVAPEQACPLTNREREALQWSFIQSKTAWEVGAIMGITERTATLHVHNAQRKLDAVNKQQAGLKALRLGWIG